MESEQYNVGYKDGASEGYALALKLNNDLIKAAIKTLNDNLHLCDGDNCTLFELRSAVQKIDPTWDTKE